MSGARKDNHLSLPLMFHVKFNANFYRSTFSQKRFQFLLRALRFDDPELRLQNVADKFNLVRVVWDRFMGNCRSLYIAGPTVTVDEMLPPFRGKVNFRMYIPSKPAKYGLKFFMVNDSKSQYCLFAIPYLGKGSAPNPLPPGVNQGEHFTMKLLAELLQKGRAVVLDNWFTSMHLAETLQSHNMHLVGTIRMNKPDLPTKDFFKSLQLPVTDSVAVHNHAKNMSLVVKRVKSTKHVGILSTIHNEFTIVEGTKTQAHMFYNANKGGTDAFDARCALSSVSRKTRRWPLCVFYTMINIAMNNAFILFESRPHPRPQHTARITTKSDYLMEVAYNMCRPWGVMRYRNLGNRQQAVKVMLDSTFLLTAAEKMQQQPPQEDNDAQPQVDDQPQIDDDQPQPQAVLPAWFPLVVPDTVPNAIRSDPKFALQPNETPFRGGRWLDNNRQRCTFCPTRRTWSGKARCESPTCGHRAICNHHSVIFCQACVYPPQ